MQQVTSFQIQMMPFPRNQRFKNKMIDYADYAQHWQYDMAGDKSRPP